MNTQNVQPLINEAVLLINEIHTLVVADLHIGIEREFRELGLQTPSQTHLLTSRLVSLMKSHNISDVFLLGDIKHTIPTVSIQERIDVRKLLEALETNATIHILPGNHDGNISKIVPKSVLLHPSDGFVFHNIGFVHGHRWPKSELFQTNYLVTAHTHPTVRLTDRLGYHSYEPCWIKGTADPTRMQHRYPKHTNPTIIVMPAFHPLCGGIAVNKDPLLGPFGKLLNLDEAECYLLDGSSLGKLSQLSP